ncbi:MAG: hypothetical protein NTW16_08535 [Bacteroidetes bacterium]|nr:hypothetical protein [Bacteroidota bacterium]
MKKNENISVAAALRQKAEALLKSRPSKHDSPLSEAETLKLFHELEVHQIELEMQSEELLREKTQREIEIGKITGLFDLAPSGYFVISREGAIVELNHTAARMLDKERSNLKSSHFIFYISDETKPLFNLFLKNSFEIKTRQSCEVALTTKGKLPVCLRLSGIVGIMDENCLVTATDVTSQKQEEEKLRQSEEKYRNIFQSLQDVYYEATIDGTLLEISPSIETISKGQYLRNDLIGKSLITN